MMSLADTAAKIGLPVFACDARKRPITERGFYAATTDAEALSLMFASPSAALIGLPTGKITECFVVDVDVKNGAQGDAWLRANAHRLPATHTVRTGSGGLHLYFRWPGRAVRNSAGTIAPGIDTRGDGGYVIIPPSDGYTVADDGPMADAPQWLLDLLFPAPQKAAEPPAAPPRDIPSRYAESALDGEISGLLRVAEGGRNNALNVAAFKLGTLVGAGLLSRATVEAELERAALLIGLDRAETLATIRSGVTAGMGAPRQVPEREERVPFGSAVYPENMDENRSEPGGKSGFEGSADAEGNRPQNGLPLVYFNDIKPNLDAADFVEGVLIEGGMSVIYGESNCGKTFFMTDLSLHIAMMKDWRGREVERGAVIYCALEGSHGISNRVAAFRKKHGLEDIEIPFAVIPSAINMLDPDADTSKLIAAIREAADHLGERVLLVVIDTLSRALAGGNENAPDDMGALVSNTDRVRQSTGAHVAYVHHSGKDAAKGARGHSLLRAATDTEIEVSRQDKDSPSVAKVTKQREMEIEGEFWFRLETVDLGTNRRGKPVTSCVVTPEEAGQGAGQSGTRAPRLTGNGQAALSMLMRAMSKSGGMAPPTGDYPPDVSVVSAKDWRTEFYNGAKPGDDRETQRKAFNRGRDELLKAGVVAAFNDLVWLVRSGT